MAEIQNKQEFYERLNELLMFVKEELRADFLVKLLELFKLPYKPIKEEDINLEDIDLSDD